MACIWSIYLHGWRVDVATDAVISISCTRIIGKYFQHPGNTEMHVWKATIAALQFWTADLEAHILSSAIEQVYNAFFYSISTYMLHQQSDEVLFGHFMTTLNAAFESNLPLKMKAMTVVVKILTYPHHLEEPPSFTMFPVKNMHPLFQTQSHHTAQVSENHTTDCYTNG